MILVIHPFFQVTEEMMVTAIHMPSNGFSARESLKLRLQSKMYESSWIMVRIWFKNLIKSEKCKELLRNGSPWLKPINAKEEQAELDPVFVFGYTRKLKWRKISNKIRNPRLIEWTWNQLCWDWNNFTLKKLLNLISWKNWISKN